MRQMTALLPTVIKANPAVRVDENPRIHLQCREENHQTNSNGVKENYLRFLGSQIRKIRRNITWWWKSCYFRHDGAISSTLCFYDTRDAASQFQKGIQVVKTSGDYALHHLLGL